MLTFLVFDYGPRLQLRIYIARADLPTLRLRRANTAHPTRTLGRAARVESYSRTAPLISLLLPAQLTLTGP